MTSSVSCCARIVNQSKWPISLHCRADFTTRYMYSFLKPFIWICSCHVILDNGIKLHLWYHTLIIFILICTHVLISITCSWHKGSHSDDLCLAKQIIGFNVYFCALKIMMIFHLFSQLYIYISGYKVKWACSSPDWCQIYMHDISEGVGQFTPFY